MRRTAYWAIAVAIVVAVAFTIAGCGTKTAIVPDTVAKVNGQEISGSDYLEQAHRAAVRQVLSNMIEQAILLQWAKDEGVPVTDEQVNKQIEAAKRDGNYDEQAKFMGEAGMKSVIQGQQARANLVIKMAKPSDDEVKGAYDMMKTRYNHGPRKQVAVIINPKKDKLDDAVKRIKGGEDFDAVAIDCSSMGAVKLWIDKDQPMLPPDLLKAATDTKVGEIAGPVNISIPNQPSQWVVVKVLKDQPNVDRSFNDVKDEVEVSAAAQKFQQDPEFGKKLNEKKKEAKVEIELPDYKEIAAQFKNPPEPMPAMSMPRRVAPSAKP